MMFMLRKPSIRAGIAQILIASICLPIADCRRSSAAEIWFAPPDNLTRGTKVYNDDFPRFWTAPQEWSFTAKHISVFQLQPYYAANAPGDTIKQISAFLTSQGISLSVGMQSVPVDDCGRGIEG